MIRTYKEKKIKYPMKKIIYYIVVFIMIIFGFPFMIFYKDRWNKFGRSIDNYFGVQSRHTKNYYGTTKR